MSASATQGGHNNEETKNKNRHSQKKRSGREVRAVSPEPGSLWWQRFVREVGLEAGVKERGSYGW